MQLIQLLLPLADNDGAPFPPGLLRAIQAELTEKFGGVTAYSRAPAKGVWQTGEGKQRDDIVILEVMAAELDRDWWRDFRKRLEKDLRQEAVIVRAQAMDLL